MGFLDDLRKKIDGIGAQVNPFDHGQTYSTVVHPQPPPQQPVKMPTLPTINLDNSVNGQRLHSSTVQYGATAPVYYNPPGVPAGGATEYFAPTTPTSQYWALPYDTNNLPKKLPKINRLP